METSSPMNVLVVAYRTAATPALLDAVRRRAEQGPARFHLLVPNPTRNAWAATASERRHTIEDADRVLALALPLIEEAAAGVADGSWSTRQDPMDAIEETLREGNYDEIILSTLPRSVSRWLHIDLPRRVEHLGLPLTTVIAADRTAAGVA